jgi:signal peptidase I
MPLFAGLNPWVSMWNQPRSTIRAIVHSKPAYGIYYLATVYALQSFFFYANWWSLGLNARYHLLMTLGVIFSPVIGVIWLYFTGLIFYLSGRLLKGTAPSAHLRSVIAWSSIPYSITLLMWLILIFTTPENVFIQDADGTSSIFVNLISLIVGIWSLVLLVQSIREIQLFSVRRSIFNVVLSWIFSAILYFVIFAVIRFLYLSFSV